MKRDDAKALGARFIANGVVLYGDRVGVIRDEEVEVSRGGIIIPDNSRKKPIRGRIIVVGLGCDPADPEDAVAGMLYGDRVSFTKYNPVTHDIELKDGAEPRDVQVEVMHISDLYFAWRD